MNNLVEKKMIEKKRRITRGKKKKKIVSLWFPETTIERSNKHSTIIPSKKLCAFFSMAS